MQDKRDISVGVVFDHDEMQQVCHRLRAIEAGIDGLRTGLGQFSDGSSAFEGLSFALHDIIKWLSPEDAVSVDELLAGIQAKQASLQDKAPAIQSAAPTGLRTRKAAGNA